eukprot:TRINITY_DN30271_c0_g1_i1.p1 TRINITY_DN30271_c0_g1~~TRINITY_DN30271_c0_g1_i1.p1  ORF type:complete len:322 (+),score=94.00 TRINITY_DN30271_c0_g1_i1:108-1073(+)
MATLRRRGGNQTEAEDERDACNERSELYGLDHADGEVSSGGMERAGCASKTTCIFMEWFYRLVDMIPGLSVVGDVPDEVVGRLRGFVARATTKFDISVPDHKTALRDYWDICQGELWRAGAGDADGDAAWDSAGAHVSKQWGLFGFQGTDPATDFRGGGVASLHNLLWFANSEPEAFTRLMGKTMSVQHALPFSIAGINLTMMLLHILQLTPTKTCFDKSASAHANPQSIVKLARRNFIEFLVSAGEMSHSAHEAADGSDCDARAVEAAFNRVYTVAFLILEGLWEDSAKNIMEFNTVLAKCRKIVETRLMNSATLEQFCK